MSLWSIFYNLQSLTLAGNQLSWLERLPCTQEVKGSTPLFSTVFETEFKSYDWSQKQQLCTRILKKAKQIIDINGKDITKRKPSTFECFRKLKKQERNR